MKKNLEVIAAYGLTNTASINIYSIEYGPEDYVLAGINDTEPQLCLVEYGDPGDDEDEDGVFFMYGEFKVLFSDVVAV